MTDYFYPLSDKQFWTFPSEDGQQTAYIVLQLESTLYEIIELSLGDTGIEFTILGQLEFGDASIKSFQVSRSKSRAVIINKNWQIGFFEFFPREGLVTRTAQDMVQFDFGSFGLQSWYFDHESSNLFTIDEAQNVSLIDISINRQVQEDIVAIVADTRTKPHVLSQKYRDVTGFKDYKVFSDWMSDDLSGKVTLVYGEGMQVLKEWVGLEGQRIGEYVWMSQDHLNPQLLREDDSPENVEDPVHPFELWREV